MQVEPQTLPIARPCCVGLRWAGRDRRGGGRSPKSPVAPLALPEATSRARNDPTMPCREKAPAALDVEGWASTQISEIALVGTPMAEGHAGGRTTQGRSRRRNGIAGCVWGVMPCRWAPKPLDTP